MVIFHSYVKLPECTPSSELLPPNHWINVASRSLAKPEAICASSAARACHRSCSFFKKARSLVRSLAANAGNRFGYWWKMVEIMGSPQKH